MSAAAELRKAAETLRHQATSGSIAHPWKFNTYPDGRAWVRSEQKPEYSIALHGFPDDARYIATMHPGVGLALADWLSHYAAVLDHGPAFADDAIAVARLINGSAA